MGASITEPMRLKSKVCRQVGPFAEFNKPTHVVLRKIVGDRHGRFLRKGFLEHGERPAWMQINPPRYATYQDQR